MRLWITITNQAHGPGVQVLLSATNRLLKGCWHRLVEYTDAAARTFCDFKSEQTMLNRLVQQNAATFFAQAKDAAGANLPRFVKDEFDAFLECGILTHGFLRLHCGDCGHDKLVAFSCKRRSFCPSCGARHTAQTVSHLVEHVIPHVPLR